MTVLSLSYDIGFRSYDIGFRSYDIGFRFQGRLAREAWEACRGGFQGRLAREACKGRLQGRFARDACKGACKGGLWGEFAKEACEGGLQGRLARETCEGKGGLHGTSLAIIFCKPLCKPPLQPPLANFPCKSPLRALLASPAFIPWDFARALATETERALVLPLIIARLRLIRQIGRPLQLRFLHLWRGCGQAPSWTAASRR